MGSACLSPISVYLIVKELEMAIWSGDTRESRFRRSQVKVFEGGFKRARVYINLKSEQLKLEKMLYNIQCQLLLKSLVLIFTTKTRK